MGKRHERQPWQDERGQSTVEFALVFVAFLSVALVLAMLWHVGRDGRMQRRVEEAASHALASERAIASARDLLLY